MTLLYPPGPLCPEMSGILAACRMDDVQFVTKGPVDAERLARLARFHRVSALVYAGRERVPLPDEAAMLLRADMLATLRRNILLGEALKDALRALGASGVPVILLKGAHLVDAIYHDPARRPMSDLDLLVRPEDAQVALAALRGRGYAADARKAAFSLAADREVRLLRCGRLDYGGLDAVIDLHTDLNRPTRHRWFPMEEVWARSVPCPREGEPARALSPADELAFLCAHAVPHAFAQLIWVCDIAGVVAAMEGEEAAALGSIARASHTVRAVRAGLHLAESILGAPVSPALWDAIGPLDAPRRAFLAPERLYGGVRYTSLSSLAFRALLSDSPADAARILASALARKARARRIAQRMLLTWICSARFP